MRINYEKLRDERIKINADLKDFIRRTWNKFKYDTWYWYEANIRNPKDIDKVLDCMNKYEYIPWFTREKIVWKFKREDFII